MRRLFGAVVTASACVVLLSSCSLLSGLPGVNGAEPDYSGRLADGQMRHIADALKDHDAAALKKVFSQRAREKATDLDSGVAYLFSLFPSGGITWRSDGPPGFSGDFENGKQTVELYADYAVSANGNAYDVYWNAFADGRRTFLRSSRRSRHPVHCRERTARFTGVSGSPFLVRSLCWCFR